MVGSPITYSYPAPKTAQPHTVTGTSTTVGSAAATTAAYTYDPAGNMTARPQSAAGNQTLTWDEEGHVATATDSGGTTTYLYDADGNRLLSRDGKGKTLYLPGEEIRFTAATSARTATRFYTFDSKLVAARNASGLTWLVADKDGTSQIAINSTTQQAVVRRMTPYGGNRGPATAWPNTRGFIGGTADETGLTHLGAREYDPALGRFISVDPVQDMKDPQQWNGYAYSNNNPTTFSDPTGLRFDDETGAECAKRM
jgi:RHS repeat-associated protein